MAGLVFLLTSTAVAQADRSGPVWLTPVETILTHDPSVPVSFGITLKDVEESFPEILAPSADGRTGVNYLSFIAPLLAAVRQLSAENKNLRLELEAVKESHSSIQPLPPMSADEPCVAGEQRVDEYFMYACMSTGTWRRWPMQEW